ILTEASYLTNPDVEARLAMAEKRRLEAEALYLGIARFFSLGAPTIESFVARGSDGRSDTTFAEIDGPVLEATVRGDFDQIELRLDGDRLDMERRGAQLRWRPLAPLRVGRHEATLRVSMAGVGSARQRTLAF